MKSPFLIHFRSQHLDYQAEVKAFDLDQVQIYDVYYTVSPGVVATSHIQVYSGRGKGPVHYWRQRLTRADEELLRPEFIEAIGYAIDQAGLSNP